VNWLVGWVVGELNLVGGWCWVVGGELNWLVNWVVEFG
jgi:hypothetical protein